MATVVPPKGLNPNAPEFIPNLHLWKSSPFPVVPHLYYHMSPLDTSGYYRAPYCRSFSSQNFYTNIYVASTQPSPYLPPPPKGLLSAIEPTISFPAEPSKRVHVAQHEVKVEKKQVARKMNPRRYRNQCSGGGAGACVKQAWWTNCGDSANFCRRRMRNMKKRAPKLEPVNQQPSEVGSSSAETKKKIRSLLLPVKCGVGKTSVMIKNIPSKYTRKMLVDFLDDYCMSENQKVKTDSAEEHFVSAFDLVYLPMDFRTGCNKGYAFVNFTDPRAVWKFYLAADRQKWELFHSNKIREIAFARLQGGELRKHLESMGFPCESEEVLPVSFSPPRDGSRELVKKRVLGTCTGLAP